MLHVFHTLLRQHCCSCIPGMYLPQLTCCLKTILQSINFSGHDKVVTMKNLVRFWRPKIPLKKRYSKPSAREVAISIFSQFLLLWAILFWYHVRACCRRAPDHTYTVLQYREHSTAHCNNQPAQSHTASTCRWECDNASEQTESIYSYCIVVPQAQHRIAQPARTKPQKQVRVDQSTTTQASRQSWREPAHTCMSSIMYTRTARWILYTNEEIKSARHTKTCNY